ncbi:MAG: ABC transporter permease [Saccharofermentanales bacterium]|jgi:putative ABC transport system permease protein
MLFKLSYRNMRRSLRDYALYFLTLTLSVVLFYMFRTATSQEAFSAYSGNIVWMLIGMTDIMKILSRFLVAVFGFLILYANRFMVKRRKREIGLYLVLGMKPRQLARMLALEILFINLNALVLGLIIGTFGSQGLSLLVMHAFLIDLSQFRFVFSPQSLVAAIIAYLVISLLVLVFIAIQLSRLKLIDLIRPERRLRHPGKLRAALSVLGFIAAILILARAYSLILSLARMPLQIPHDFPKAIVLGIIGTYLLFASLTGFLLRLAQLVKPFYYRRLNYFTLRQIAARMSSFWLSLATTALLLFFTLSILSVSFFFIRESNRLLAPYSTDKKFDIEAWIEYDLSIEPDSGRILNKQEMRGLSLRLDDSYRRNYAAQIAPLQGDTRYGIVTSSLTKFYFFDEGDLGLSAAQDQVSDHIRRTWEDLKNTNGQLFLLISAGEAAKALEQQGLTPAWSDTETVLLGHPLVPAAREIAGGMRSEALKLTVKQGHLNAILDFDQVLVDDNFWPLLGMQGRLLAVVPNELIAGMELQQQGYRIALQRQPEAEADHIGAIRNLFYDLQEDIGRDLDLPSFTGMLDYIDSKAELEANAGVKVMLSFVGLYICLTFILITATILALQHLSEISDNRIRYRILSQIGARRGYLRRQIITETALYFYLPLFVAILHSTFAFRFFSGLIELVGLSGYLRSTILATLVVIAVYSLYFILTVFSATRLALPARKDEKI